MSYPIKIAIVDFSSFFNEESILKFIVPEFTPIIDYVNPDIVFYSTFGTKHLKYKNAIKILINVESFIPDFNDCDYAISTIKLEFLDRNLWIPACFWFSKNITATAAQISEEFALNRKFCVFLYSQDFFGEGALLRKNFCQKLIDNYKHVECPGKVLNNTICKALSTRESNDWIETKRKYFSNFKFCIAFENMNFPGYITEKLIDCYLSNTVPIYWGSEGALAPFPKESMICAHDFSNMDELINYIKLVDSEKELYLKILNANPFRNNLINSDFNNQIRNFLYRVITERKFLFKNTHPLSSARHYQELNDSFVQMYWYIRKKIKQLIKKQ